MHHFTPKTLRFLNDLAANNRRDWFEAHRGAYEQDIREPALRLITAMEARIREVHPAFMASPKKVGGSLFRIHRDTRFSGDKTPYKTHIGITFFHAATRATARTADTGNAARGRLDAPVFYLHIAPGASFMGGGIWHPQAPALRQIREYLVDNPASWRAVTQGPAFARHYTLGGEVLVRPPKGFDAQHALINDLKRKDFIASAAVADEDLMRPDLPAWLTRRYQPLAPLVDWLCDALTLPTDGA